jgi:SseB protein N-terminal domain
MESASPDREGGVEAALAAVAAGGDEDAALRAIARAQLLLPRMTAAGDIEPRALALPVVEQDGTGFVPIFTSQARLRAAMPEATGAVQVDAASLAARWPSDDLWLAIDPASPHAAKLPAAAVRALAHLASE